MNRMKQGMSFAALLLSSTWGAQAAATTDVFSSVTGIQYTTGITITGILANDTTPTTHAIPATVASCLGNITNFLSTMISNPGTYTLTLVVPDADPTGPPVTVSTCRLDRV